MRKNETIADCIASMGLEKNAVRRRCSCGRDYVCLGEILSLQCPECADAAVRQQEARKATSEAEDRTIANIPPRYQWATLDTPELAKRVSSPSAITLARMVKDEVSVLLLGNAGSGKTSLAAAILRATATRERCTGRFVKSFDLAKARQEHPLGDGESPAIERAMKAKVLVVDELGAEHGRNTAMQELIQERHDHDRPTIFTSGFSLPELEQRYGVGIMRRVLCGKVIQCNR